MDLKYNGGHFFLRKGDLLRSNQLYHISESSHVHVFNHLLHESIMEKTGIKLDEIFGISSGKIWSKIVKELFAMLLLGGIDGLDCKDVFLAIEFVDCPSDHSCTSFAEYLKFLDLRRTTLMAFGSILILSNCVLGSDNLLMPCWSTTRSTFGNLIICSSLNSCESTWQMRRPCNLHWSLFQKMIHIRLSFPSILRTFLVTNYLNITLQSYIITSIQIRHNTHHPHQILLPMRFGTSQ